MNNGNNPCKSGYWNEISAKDQKVKQRPSTRMVTFSWRYLPEPKIVACFAKISCMAFFILFKLIIKGKIGKNWQPYEFLEILK